MKNRKIKSFWSLSIDWFIFLSFFLLCCCLFPGSASQLLAKLRTAEWVLTWIYKELTAQIVLIKNCKELVQGEERSRISDSVLVQVTLSGRRRLCLSLCKYSWYKVIYTPSHKQMSVHTHAEKHSCTYTSVYIHIHTYILLCVYMCLCMCMCVRSNRFDIRTKLFYKIFSEFNLKHYPNYIK